MCNWFQINRYFLLVVAGSLLIAACAFRPPRPTEALLDSLYLAERVAEAREKWRMRILLNEHLVPGLGSIAALEETT